MGPITQHFPKSFDHWSLLSIDYGLEYAECTYSQEAQAVLSSQVLKV